jgi:hypothetical protein
MMATIDMEDRKRPLDISSLENPAIPTKRPHLDRSNSSFGSNKTPLVKEEASESIPDDDDSTPAYKGLEVSPVVICSQCEKN